MATVTMSRDQLIIQNLRNELRIALTSNTALMNRLNQAAARIADLEKQLAEPQEMEIPVDPPPIEQPAGTGEQPEV